MKAFLVLICVSVASGLQPCASPFAAVQAAPFASPFPGGPVPFGGPGPAGPPVDGALMARLAPMVQQFTATLNSGNAESHAAMYTNDSIVAPDSDFHYYGRIGARILATKNKAANKLTGPIEIQDIKQGGDYLMMRGRFTDSIGPGDVIQYWKDTNGKLELAFMLYDWDSPATAPAVDKLGGDPEAKKRAQAVLDEYSQKYGAGDIEGVSHLYTQFAKIFPVEGFIRLGQEGARKALQDMKDSGITNVTYEVVGGYKAGDNVIAWTYYKNFKGSQLIEEGTDVYVMKEEAGQLKIQYDIWNIEWTESERTATDKTAQAFYDEYVSLFNAGKITELMAKYAPDAIRTEAGSPTWIGIPAIQQDLQNDYNSGVRYRIDVLNAYPAGDYIIVNGRQRTVKDGVVESSSKLEDLLRLDHGTPKYLWDTQATN